MLPQEGAALYDESSQDLTPGSWSRPERYMQALRDAGGAPTRIAPLLFVPRNLMRLSLVCVLSSECMCIDSVA